MYLYLYLQFEITAVFVFVFAVVKINVFVFVFATSSLYLSQLWYKLDLLKIVEYKFSCEMEAHVEVTTSKRHFNV